MIDTKNDYLCQNTTLHLDMNTPAQHYINKLGLEPHPEGGYYRQVYGNDASAFHRFHGVVEIWYYHAGEPLNLYVIDTEGNLAIHNLSPDGEMQVVIQPEEWFAAEIPSKNGFCLVGCAVAPAFTFENFELADKNELSRHCPQYTELIERLT